MSGENGSHVVTAFKQVLKALRAAENHHHTTTASVYAAVTPPPVPHTGQGMGDAAPGGGA